MTGPPPSCAAAARRPRRALERLAEAVELARRPPASGRRAEPARAAVGLLEPLQRRLALAGGGERDAGAERDLRALERASRGRLQLQRARELVRRRRPRRPRASAVSPSACASAASASGWPPAAAIAESASRAGAGAREVAVARRTTSPPCAGPRPRSGGPRCAPSARARRGSARAAARRVAGVRPRSSRAPPRCRRPSRRRRAAPPCCRQRVSSGRAARASPRKARIEPSTPSATSASSGGVRAGAELAAQLAPPASQSPSSRRT